MLKKQILSVCLSCCLLFAACSSSYSASGLWAYGEDTANNSWYLYISEDGNFYRLDKCHNAPIKNAEQKEPSVFVIEDTVILDTSIDPFIISENTAVENIVHIGRTALETTERHTVLTFSPTEGGNEIISHCCYIRSQQIPIEDIERAIAIYQNLQTTPQNT